MLENRLTSTVTYWAKGSPDGYGGYVYTAPEELPARWEAHTKLIVNAAGNQRQTRMQVFLSQDVEIGGFLYLGSSSETSPTALGTNVYEIIDFMKIPSVDGINYEYRAFV